MVGCLLRPIGGYSTRMTEEQGGYQEYSVQDISNLLDEVIEASYEAEAAEDSLKDYEANNDPPSLPDAQEFGDAGALAEFKADEARYNRGLQEATQERDRSSQRFERVADTLRDILPSGTQVFHHYDSEAPSVQMGRYRIAHHLGGSIEVAYVGD